MYSNQQHNHQVKKFEGIAPFAKALAMSNVALE
jgi:hypothetical protein